MMKNIIIKIWGSVMLIALFTACGGGSADSGKLQVKEITAKQLKEKIAKQEEEFTLIDVRSEDEQEDGKIEGSVSIPKDSLKSKISDDKFWEEEFMYAPADSSQIILYSKKGKVGTDAALILKELGFKDVSNLEGGYETYSLNIKRDKLM